MAGYQYYTKAISEAATENAVHLLSFADLLEGVSLEQADLSRKREWLKQVAKTDRSLRKGNTPLTWMVTAEGIAWFDDAHARQLSQQLEDYESQLNGSLYPVWHLSSEELWDFHLQNLQALLLGVLLDEYFYHRFQSMPEMADETGKKKIQQRLQALKAGQQFLQRQEEGGQFVTHPAIRLYERARISEELFSRGAESADTLGYDRDQLRRAQGVIERRLAQAVPNFEREINRVRPLFTKQLRQAEVETLQRNSDWVQRISRLQDPPPELQMLQPLLQREQAIAAAHVSEREQELGTTAAGQSALQSTRPVRDFALSDLEFIEKGPELPQPDPAQPKAPSSKRKPAPKDRASNTKRMVNRLRPEQNKKP